MRVRMIERKILYNKKLIRCGIFGSTLYTRLILIADDCGRFLGETDAIKAAAFPMMEEVTAEMIECAIAALVREGLILLYRVRDNRYLQLVGWNEHQLLRYKTPEYPAPEEGVMIDPTENTVADAQIDNNIISISKEDETRRDETGRDEKKSLPSLSIPPSDSPRLSPPVVPSGDAAATSGGALGREGEEQRANERFERFWSAYPRHEKKHEARRVFLGVCRDDALLSKMLESIAAFRTTDQWMRDNGRYIPLPTQWLRGARWEDEPPRASPSVPERTQTGSFDTDDFFEAALKKKFSTRRSD